MVEIDLPSHTGDSHSPGWCGPFQELCPTPRCAHNALDPSAELTYAIISDIVKELAAALPDAYLHFGGDEVLQDALNPHDCWQADPKINGWLNTTFPPAGRDPRGHGGAVAYFNDKIEAIARGNNRSADSVGGGILWGQRRIPIFTRVAFSLFVFILRGWSRPCRLLLLRGANPHGPVRASWQHIDSIGPSR